MKSLRLLVVEDEPDMRRAVSRALEDYSYRMDETGDDLGFDISGVGSAEQALDIIQGGKADLVLLDHKLPGMSGIELLEQIGGNGKDLMVIMMTAYASLDIGISATRKGAYEFLAKPFTPDELKSALGKAARHLLLSRQARHLEQEKKKVRFEFISLLAHELKAPLAAVEQYLGLAAGSLAEGDKVEPVLLERSIVRIREMRKLILDLLDLTRIESGAKKREMETLNLAELAGRVVQDLSAQAAEREVTVHVACDPDLTMKGDRWEVRSVLANLVSNAVKYNRHGGKVEISVGADEEWFEIKVADTGIGIAEENISGLFAEFGRLRNKDTENVPGSGLGLSIVKKIASLYQGEVSVESIEGKGSVFTVRLKSAAG